MSASPSRGLDVGLLLAMSALLPLFVSAMLFVRLPPPGKPAAELGWPSTRLSSLSLAVLEPDQRYAWLVLRSGTDGPPVLDACRVELETGRALACPAVLKFPPGQEPHPLLHAVGPDALLLVAGAQAADRSKIWRAAIVSPRGAVELPLPLPWPSAREAAITNIAWSKQGRFDLFASGAAEEKWLLARARLEPSGQLHPWEVREIADPKAHRQLAFAQVPADPPEVVVPGSHMLERLSPGGRKPIQLPSCSSGHPVFCVTPSAAAVHSFWPSLESSWLDPTGRVVPYDIPAEAVGVRQWSRVEALRADGTADPLLVSETSGDRAGVWKTSSFTIPNGSQISLTLRQRGNEQLVLARSSQGREARVARGSYALGDWTPVPFATGVLLLDRSGGRVVVMDRELQTRVSESRVQGLLQIARKRLSLDWLSTSLFLSMVLGVPVLLVLGLRARRAARDGREPHAVLLFALYAAAAAGLLVLLVNHDYIFPPW